ncbi:MAG: tRNA pseudouridine(55) synthase TruB [Coriobacteriia bacterium]|nr:tRNA pseudouridine(55) synthase TruB [Coriobacteriia bacterium]MCL2536915.1 tRNA pseudouridine(55) synthase TruB [Coriobacteriia bacterium]
MSEPGAARNKARQARSRRGATALSGVLLLDKPTGWTSHDLVGKLRTLTGERRIGHAGTLDPDASGLMIMLIGPATKLSADFTSEHKSYRARIQFGSSTTTDDAQGDLLETSPIPEKVLDPVYAQELLDSFLGESDQIPPDFSALKQGGKIAHREARKGTPLNIPARPIVVTSATLISIEEVSWVVDFTVSKGTYIRALARDIGRAAGTHAHLSELCRTTSGDFWVADAHTLEEIEQHLKQDPNALADFFISRDELLHSMPAQRLNAASVAGTRVGPSVLTIGVFDGVHEGHQALLRAVVARAHEQGLLATALTFDLHPKEVMRPSHAPAPLMTLDDKVAAIKNCGIDQVIVLPFNQKLGQQSAADFLTLTLPALVQTREIMVGENFRCGKGADTGPAQMAELLPDIKVTVAELESDEAGIPYSSTRIRTARRASSGSVCS